MKRFPELKPNFWDVIVVLAVIALAALSAMTVWRGGTETGDLTDCVRTGTISRGGQSIVCLPARIVIQLTGGAADSNDVDIVIG